MPLYNDTVYQFITHDLYTEEEFLPPQIPVSELLFIEKKPNKSPDLPGILFSFITNNKTNTFKWWIFKNETDRDAIYDSILDSISFNVRTATPGGATGNFIPITGTVTGSEVTGPVIFDSAQTTKILGDSSSSAQIHFNVQGEGETFIGNPNYQESWIESAPTYVQFGFGDGAVVPESATYLADANGIWIFTSSQAGPTQNTVLQAKNNETADKVGEDQDSFAVWLGSRKPTSRTGVKNSVAVGGKDLDLDQDNGAHSNYFANKIISLGANVSTNQSIDIQLGAMQKFQLAVAAAITIDAVAPTTKNSADLSLSIKQPSGTVGTVTFGANFAFAGGTPPVLTASSLAKDLFVFRSTGSDYVLVQHIPNYL